MSVFIDVINNLLKYNEQDVFIVVDKYNQIWFKLKDIIRERKKYFFIFISFFIFIYFFKIYIFYPLTAQ